MDEFTFQHELHLLKQRVSEMSTSHQSRASPRQPSRDHFSEQLQDVKAHLASLQTHLALFQNFAQPKEGIPTQATKQPVAMPVEANNMILPPHGGFNVPSGPLYWQLFSSLRSDVQIIDRRVATLEDSMSELEDRIDRLDPHRFTPASSVASSEAHEESAMRFSKHTAPSLPNSGRPVTEYQDAHAVAWSPTELQDVQAARAQFSSGLAALGRAFEVLTSSAPAGRPKTVSYQSVTAQSVPQELSGNESVGSHVSEARSYVDRAVEQLRQDKEAVRSCIESGKQNNEQLKQQNTDLQHKVSTLDDENLSLMVAVRRMQANSFGHQRSQPIEPASVIYRDQEIARLDELLRNATEKLNHSESLAANKTRQVEALIDELGKRHAWCKQQKAELERATAQLQEKEVDLGEARDWYLWKCQEHKRRCEWLQQSKDHNEHDLHIAEDRICELERVLQDCQNSKDEEIDQMIATRDAEIKRGQEFCEQKDAVIEKQEGMIQRGVELLMQRDKDIEALEEKLAALEEDKRTMREDRSQLVQLLHQRDDDIVTFKRQIDSLQAKIRAAHEKRRRDAERQQAVTPLAWAAKAAGEGEVLETQRSWTPKRIDGYTRLPHEDQRAYVWQEDARQPAPEFGKPSPLSVPSHWRAAWDSEKDKPVMFRRSSNGTVETVPFPVGHQPTATESARRAKDRAKDEPTTADSEHKPPPPRPASLRRHHKLPLDVTFNPPLPAPVATAHKASSTTNLRGSAKDQTQDMCDKQRVISKHQSLQDLPRRKLQAYVETEGESGDERRDACLLD